QAALGGRQSITDLVLPGGRLHEQRDRAWQRLNEIPGVSCVKPQGALYAFPRLDPAVHQIHDDEQLVLDLLLREKIQVVQGTGFNWPHPDHLRILTLPRADDLDRPLPPPRPLPPGVPAVPPTGDGHPRHSAGSWQLMPAPVAYCMRYVPAGRVPRREGDGHRARQRPRVQECRMMLTA